MSDTFAWGPFCPSRGSSMEGLGAVKWGHGLTIMTGSPHIEFRAPPSRYTENKVLFSVPCVYARKLFLGGLVRLFEVYERYLCLGAVLSIQRVFYGRPGGSQMGSRSHHHDRVPTHRVQISLLQGTLKTRYFSVYLACMRVKRFFGAF